MIFGNSPNSADLEGKVAIGDYEVEREFNNPVNVHY